MYCGKGRGLGLAPHDETWALGLGIAVDAVVGRTVAQRTVASKDLGARCAEHRHPHANLVFEPLLAKSIAAGRHARAALNPVSLEGAIRLAAALVVDPPVKGHQRVRRTVRGRIARVQPAQPV